MADGIGDSILFGRWLGVLFSFGPTSIADKYSDALE